MRPDLGIEEAPDVAQHARGAADDEVVIEIGGDAPRRPVIERRPLDRCDGAGGDDGISGRVGVGEERQQMVEDGAGPGEVPVAVIGQVDRRWVAGGGAHLDPQLVVVGERVHRPRLDGARIAGLALRRVVAEREGGAVRGSGQHGPGQAVPAAAAAVQVVRRIVGLEMVGDAGEREARLANAVRHPAADGAQKEILRRVGGRIVEAEHHVAQPSGAIGDPQLDQRGPERRDGGRRAARVGERVKLARQRAHRAEGRAAEGRAAERRAG